jgi:hypothetical protein
MPGNRFLADDDTVPDGSLFGKKTQTLEVPSRKSGR